MQAKIITLIKRAMADLMGGCNPNKRKKTSPKFEICGGVRFFSVFSVFYGFFGFFSGIFGFLWYFFGFSLSVRISTRNSSHPKIMSTMRSREAKNCPITHFMPIKP